MTVVAVAPGQTIASSAFGNAVIAALVPTGAVIPYAGSSAPANWLLCDGSTASRTTYAELFDVIGVTYGNGDGTTTFNLPDLRGRAPFGYKAGDANHGTLGGTGGSGAPHTLLLTELPSHDHGGVTGGQSATHNHDDAGHSHSPIGAGAGDWAIRYPGSIEGLMLTPDGADTTFTTQATDYADIGDASNDHTHTIPAAGGGVAFSVHDEFATLNFLIKT